MPRALLATLWVTVVNIAIGQAPARLELVRCAAGADVPCVRARIALDANARIAMGQLNSADETTAWSGELAGNPLVGPGLAAARTTVLPMRLLILIDRGAAMSGEGIAFTRIALKSWLSTLDSAAIKVCVVGFDGRELRQTIMDAIFQSPGSAIASVDTLPAPASKGRSPLYSAILFGVRRVAAAIDSVRSSGGGVLVITMGRNDVGRGKDATDLLAGDVGLSQASTGVGSARQRTWIVALNPAAPLDELRTLAGPAGSVYTVALDPNAIASRLAAVAREFVSARELTFGVGAIGAAALGRTAVPGSVALHVDANRAAVAALAWRPPLIAMPAFQGVAEPAALSPALREALLLGVGGGGDRPFVALLIGVLVAGIWVLAPRLGWRDSFVANPAVRERATTTRTAVTGVKSEEGPPRKPEDITHQTARRTALRR
jgi:hypothetical protein